MPGSSDSTSAPHVQAAIAAVKTGTAQAKMSARPVAAHVQAATGAAAQPKLYIVTAGPAPV